MAVHKSRAEYEQQKHLARMQFSAHFNKDMHNWMMLYPAYINAKKTIATGRQIAVSDCPDNPTAKEIADVLSSLGFKVLLEERNTHPKEPFRDSIHCGRVRVLLWSRGEEDGKPVPINPDYPGRKSIMKLAAKSILNLRSRQDKSKHPSAQGGGKAANNPQRQKGTKKGKK